MTNAGGGGVLAADACADHGLRVVTISEPIQRRLRELLPTGAAVAGPVDTTASVGVDAFRACLEEVAADDGVDAVLAVTVPTAVADPSEALSTARVTKPLVAAVLDVAEAVWLLPAAPPPHPAPPRHPAPPQESAPPVPGIPAYAYPESAARALGHAVRYHAWRERQQARVPELPGVRPADARALVAKFLAAARTAAGCPPAAVSDLLACYEIPLGTGNEAVSPTASQVDIGVVQEPMFGPLVVFGLSGIAAERLRRPRRPAHPAHRRRRGRPDPRRVRRARRCSVRAAGPLWTPRRSPASCCGFPGSPTTSPKSPSSTSTR